MASADACCALVAASQHGCLTLAQAATCGLSGEAVRRRVRRRLWRRVLPRTYAVQGAPPSWEQRLMAAVLWVGEGAASGASAAALWRFPDFAPGPIEVSHTGTRSGRRGIAVRRVDLPARDVARIRGIPATTPARTLADVAATARSDRFDAAFHYCLHERLATPGGLHDLCERRTGSGFAGAARLRAAVAAYAEGRPAASPLEARLERRLRRSKIPAPLQQHEVRLDGHRYFLDFAWPDERVAVEVDGYRWHSSREAWRRDRERLTTLRRAGWTVVNATREDVDDRFDELASELRTLLR
ncbi:MAG: endonuclease domain-containing protein [Actinomycetota bacterium]